MSYPHRNPWFAPSIAPATSPPAREVESLARAVLAREQLSLQDLPRCRREVRMQLALTLTALRRGASSNAIEKDAPAERR